MFPPHLSLSFHIGTSFQLKPIWSKSKKSYLLDDIGAFIIDLNTSGKEKYVIVMDRDQLVAAWGFFLQGPKTYRIIKGSGIIVKKQYRRRGLSKRMIKAGISLFNPGKISAGYITDKGYTMYLSLMDEYPNIVWNIKTWMRRQGIDLRRK